MNAVYQKFVGEFNNNKICYFQENPSNYKIHVIAMAEDFDSWFFDSLLIKNLY